MQDSKEAREPNNLWKITQNNKRIDSTGIFLVSIVVNLYGGLLASLFISPGPHQTFLSFVNQSVTSR